MKCREIQRNQVNNAEEDFIQWACETFPNKCKNKIGKSTGKMDNSGDYKLYIAYKK